MKVKIEKTEEKNGLFRVHTECVYGKDNIGLSLNAKYLNPDTEKPKWEKEVKELLKQKYGKDIQLENKK